MECIICSIKFKSKSNYTKHLNTERHKKRSSNLDMKSYSCMCGKKYLHSQSLYLHRKTCETHNFSPKQTSYVHNNIKDVNFLVKQMAETIQMKNSQIEQLTNQISILLEKASLGSNTNSHNNTNNIETQNVIVVNSFGHENTEYLTDQIVSKLIQNGPFTCLPKIIERIHFDPDHPENHNIKVTNQKNNYAKIIKDNKWITTNKKQAIDAMIQNGYGLLEEKYQDNKETIPEFKQERFEDFQEKYGEQDKDFMKNIKDQVDIAIINGSEQIHK